MRINGGRINHERSVLGILGNGTEWKGIVHSRTRANRQRPKQNFMRKMSESGAQGSLAYSLFNHSN